jgi:hypothetical protein
MRPTCGRWARRAGNVSVWRDVASLNRYVCGSAHVEIMRRRRERFERLKESHMVLWWVPRGHRPTVEEAIGRLELLRTKGPGPQAFTFRQAFPSPDTAGVRTSVDFGDACPAT